MSVAGYDVTPGVTWAVTSSVGYSPALRDPAGWDGLLDIQNFRIGSEKVCDVPA